MSKLEKICIGVLIALVVFALAARIVLAEDNEIGFCTDKNAVNYIGADIIQLYEDEGYRVVDDGSCYCLELETDSEGNVLAANDVSCKSANTSYNDFMFAEYGPAYYGKPIEVGGCTDPAAINWMDPIWWPDYSIIEDGSCYYELENAL